MICCVNINHSTPFIVLFTVLMWRHLDQKSRTTCLVLYYYLKYKLSDFRWYSSTSVFSVSWSFGNFSILFYAVSLHFSIFNTSINEYSVVIYLIAMFFINLITSILLIISFLDVRKLVEILVSNFYISQAIGITSSGFVHIFVT